MATDGKADDKQNGPERRFQGVMTEDYLLVRRAVPAFDEFQRLVVEAVAAHSSPDPSRPLRVLDLGCGDGVTSAAILSRRLDAADAGHHLLPDPFPLAFPVPSGNWAWFKPG
jgi:hypothetical protein